MYETAVSTQKRGPWNKGKVFGQKRPLRPKDIWAIRIHLELQRRRRDLALFNLGIDSKLRSCDLVRQRVNDVVHGGKVLRRATVVQSKTQRPVQFEVTETTRTAVQDWLKAAGAQFERRFSGVWTVYESDNLASLLLWARNRPTDLRLRRPTVTINGEEVRGPLDATPLVGQRYWAFDPTAPRPVYSCYWEGSDMDHRSLARGFAIRRQGLWPVGDSYFGWLMVVVVR